LAAAILISWAAIGGAVQAAGVPLFSYDSATGQFPTDQGWSAFEVVTSGTGANASIVSLSGTNVLRMRDLNTGTAADLPNYYFPWTTQQQQQLIDYGLEFTFVTQLLASGGSNLRFGFNNTLFETVFDNITADQMITVPLGASLVGGFNTIVVTGSAVNVSGSNNFVFSYTVNGTASTALTPTTNPSPATIESSVYFGSASSAGTSGDMYVRLADMRTIIVPEPAACGAAVVAVAAAGMGMRLRVGGRRRMKPTADCDGLRR
jgi:hypothetical protein